MFHAQCVEAVIRPKWHHVGVAALWLACRAIVASFGIRSIKRCHVGMTVASTECVVLLKDHLFLLLVINVRLRVILSILQNPLPLSILFFGSCCSSCF